MARVHLKLIAIIILLAAVSLPLDASGLFRRKARCVPCPPSCPPVFVQPSQLDDGSKAPEHKDIVASDGWGSLRGKATFKGELPKIAEASGPMPKDKTWIIDPETKGVANVVVWLEPMSRHYFWTHEDDRRRKESLSFTIREDFDIEPRVCVYYPRVFDGFDMIDTGQTLTLRKDGQNNYFFTFKAIHWPTLGEREASMLEKFGEEPVFLRAALTEQIPELRIKNTPLHYRILLVSEKQFSWSKAYLFVVDHPYFAITKADGSFTIPRVPAGADVRLMAWHEGAGFVFGREGKKTSFEKNRAAVVDFEVEIKKAKEKK